MVGGAAGAAGGVAGCSCGAVGGVGGGAGRSVTGGCTSAGGGGGLGGVGWVSADGSWGGRSGVGGAAGCSAGSLWEAMAGLPVPTVFREAGRRACWASVVRDFAVRDGLPPVVRTSADSVCVGRSGTVSLREPVRRISSWMHAARKIVDPAVAIAMACKGFCVRFFACIRSPASEGSLKTSGPSRPTRGRFWCEDQCGGVSRPHVQEVGKVQAAPLLPFAGDRRCASALAAGYPDALAAVLAQLSGLHCQPLTTARPGEVAPGGNSRPSAF